MDYARVEVTDEDIDDFFGSDGPVKSYKSTCTHLASVKPVPDNGIDHEAPCSQCSSTEENWICLSCYKVLCSRYINEHMVAHTKETNHLIALSLRDVTVWCYGCDDYVNDAVLDGAIKIVFNKKYGN